MTALKRAIADKAETKASGNYVNADANKRQAYDEKRQLQKTSLVVHQRQR